MTLNSFYLSLRVWGLQAYTQCWAYAVLGIPPPPQGFVHASNRSNKRVSWLAPVCVFKTALCSKAVLELLIFLFLSPKC